jgi:phosphoglycolate phosphatase-like HAD superfamily hydrolase
MNNSAQALIDLDPAKKHLVAIDSDGCAFDAMGIKQRECFCPMMIAYFGLQPVAQAARECKEFADLYSKTRGANRHKTIVRILTELLPSHPAVKQRDFKVPEFKYYAQWVNNPNSLLSDAGLKKSIETSSNPDEKEELQRVLTWSQRVNEMVAEIVKDVPPFPFVRESLEKVFQFADIIVCSATPTEALEREWSEHGLTKYVKVIAGQEMGSKAQHLAIVSQTKYDKDNIIMLGDALGDLDAAEKNSVLFYPINPGGEEASWKRFHDEAFDKFIANNYNGDYEKNVITEFEKTLPTHPEWMKTTNK